jgi:hypothetical protein
MHYEEPGSEVADHWSPYRVIADGEVGDPAARLQTFRYAL